MMIMIIVFLYYYYNHCYHYSHYKIFLLIGLKPYAGLSTTELIDQLKIGYRLEKPDGCSDAV